MLGEALRDELGLSNGDKVVFWMRPRKLAQVKWSLGAAPDEPVPRPR